MQTSKYTHSVITSSKVVNFDDWIFGFNLSRIGTYGNIADYYYVDGNYIYVNEDLDNLCFVHGDIKDLENGKKCVVRNRVVEYNKEANTIDKNGHIKWTKKRLKRQ